MSSYEQSLKFLHRRYLNTVPRQLCPENIAKIIFKLSYRLFRKSGLSALCVDPNHPFLLNS